MAPESAGTATRSSGRSLRGCLSALATTLVLSSLAAPASTAATAFRQAQIRRIIDGREVYIDQRQAKVSDIARQGNTLRTRRSRAELLFDRRAIGLMGRETLIRLGSRCFRLDSGAILVNGGQRSCIASKVLGVRGTTYVLERSDAGGYVLSVLVGEAELGDEPAEGPEEGDILSRFPRANPSIGVGASAFATEGRDDEDRFSSGGSDDLLFGPAFSLIRGELDLMLPLVQHESRRELYFHTWGSSNFDGYGAVSSELGLRWYTPSNRSITGLYLGYGGFGNPVCFNSMVNGGLHWERNRWRLGAAVGVNADACDNGLSYAALSLGIPVAHIGDDSVHLSLTPYGLSGAGESWLGGRLALDVPATEALSLNLYGSYDPFFRGAVGGGIRYRIPLGGGFVRDPNPPAVLPSADPQSRASARRYQDVAAAAAVPAVAAESARLAQAAGPIVVRTGQQAVLDEDGNLVGPIRTLGPQEFADLVQRHQGGQNPLPEGGRIAEAARLLGLGGGALRRLQDITGHYFVNQSGQPVSEVVDTPFWNKGIEPTLSTQDDEDDSPSSDYVPPSEFDQGSGGFDYEFFLPGP